MTLASPSAGMPATRDMSAAWFAFMGIDRDAPPEYRTPSAFAKAPADEAWVYSCVNKIASSGAGVPLRVYVKHGRDLVPAADEPTPEGDDLQYLLDNANPVDMTGTDLKSYNLAAHTVWGETFMGKVRGRRGGPPQELYWLRAPDMTPKAPNGRQVLAWTHRPTGIGDETVYEPRNVIHWKTWNLVNPLRGLSPLSSVGSEIATGVLWAQRLAATVANDSIPPGFWQVPANAEFTKQDEGLVKRTLRALRGPRNKGRTAIMPQGLDFKAISLTPQAAEMIANRKVSRMAVCAVTGVPLVLAGDDEKTSVYANLRDAERVFWRGTMVPKLDGYADILNNWLVPDFDATRRRLVVAFDYSEIEALKPTLDVEWNMWLGGIYSQAVVPNEFRRHFRLGADVPWGDRPVPRTAVAIRPDPAALDPAALPTLDPALEAALPETSSTIVADESSAAGTLRSFGRDLYKQPAVRAWVANPYEPLDTAALFAGRSVPTELRLSIEAGLRRRDPAAAIAASLEVPA
jgi:HK97 family phage portal protein